METPFFIAPRGRRCPGCPVRNCTVCSSLDAVQLAELDAVASFRKLLPKQSLVFEDDLEMPVANVLTGQLKVSRSLPDGRTQVMRVLRPGDFFDGGKISAGVTVSALTDSSVCIVPRELLDRLAVKHRALERAVRAELESELADAQDHLLALGRMTAAERVADFLLREQSHALKVGENGHPLTLHLSRAEIADYLGLTTETVSRTFTRLKNAGLIRFEPGRLARVHIRDPRRLAVLAGSHPPAGTRIEETVTLSQGAGQAPT